MKKLTAVCAVLVATAVFADTKEAPPAMDMTKMGPAARKVTDEKKTKKELEAFFKAADEADKKGDFEAGVAAIDFPVYMATDDLKGVPEARAYSKDEYVAMMKPMMENMPKDVTTTHKRSITVLSDSLANVVDDWTMTMGKVKTTGKNATLVVKVGADWKLKTMVEAGWGGMSAPAAAPAPAKTTAAAPAPAAAPAAAPAKK
ncbi:MAG: hypothetical protein IAE78_02335 [Myxococcus sp.]|nr:hypothetical protein [Myxococcus sp.]